MEGANGTATLERRSAYVLSQRGADTECDYDSEHGERGSKNARETTRGPLDSPPPNKEGLDAIQRFCIGSAARSLSKT